LLKAIEGDHPQKELITGICSCSGEYISRQFHLQKKEVFIFYVKNICSVDVFMHDPHNFVLNSISRDIVQITII